MKKSVYISGYYGYGDCIYQFPFVKELSKHYQTIYLKTPFPQLFDSIPNVKFIKPRLNRLATSNRHINKYSNKYETELPIIEDTLQFHYQRGQKLNIGMSECFNNIAPTLTERPIDWTLPIKKEWMQEAHKVLAKIHTKKKICLIKRPSIREEWKNSARVGKVEYFQYLIDKYKKDYYFISVANDNIEKFMGELKGIDKRFEKGELTMETILGLASLSDLIIAYHSFLVAVGIATQTKTFCIFGGYVAPHLWVDYERMNLNDVRYVAPNEFCNCFNPIHNCNKEIPLEKIDQEFEALINSPSTKISVPNIVERINKKNLLISRIRAERCHVIAQNKWIDKEFNLFTVDHTNTISYKAFGKEFKDSFMFPSVGNVCIPVCPPEKEQEIYDYCKKMINDCSIDMVINSQPLHPYNTIMARVCKEMGIKSINTEMFCDSKLIFDYEGCQYTKNNEIYKYVNSIPMPKDDSIIDYPLTTRQPQPNTISKAEFYTKYKLDPKGKYIVLLGQLLWDMSVKHFTNPEIKDYTTYVKQVINNNPNTTFIVKPHPLYLKHNRKDFDFCKGKNVVIVNESLETLFNIFDNYTSFSSTTIFEGLIRNKKFATMGFHFCNNDNLVYQLRKNGKEKDLYNHLTNLKIDKKTLERYLYFVCNYYTIKMESDKLLSRLTLTSDEYFKLPL
jgi:ADP-heptose:LPS heptosyltransferase